MGRTYEQSLIATQGMNRAPEALMQLILGAGAQKNAGQERMALAQMQMAQMGQERANQMFSALLGMANQKSTQQMQTMETERQRQFAMQMQDRQFAQQMAVLQMQMGGKRRGGRGGGVQPRQPPEEAAGQTAPQIDPVAAKATIRANALEQAYGNPTVAINKILEQIGPLPEDDPRKAWGLEVTAGLAPDARAYDNKMRLETKRRQNNPGPAPAPMTVSEVRPIGGSSSGMFGIP